MPEPTHALNGQSTSLSFEERATLAYVEAVYEVARPLIGFDVEVITKSPHRDEPVRGQLLRVGRLTDPQPSTVLAFFGTGHLVIDEGDWPMSTYNVAPRNVESIRALPTARNAVAVIA